MPAVDVLFLCIIGLSVGTCAYLLGTILHAWYSQRDEARAYVLEPEWEDGSCDHPQVYRFGADARIAGARMRRSGTSSSAPDLLTVTGTGYAVMLLHIQQPGGRPDLIESRVFLN